jgi:hypothetical protein
LAAPSASGVWPNGAQVSVSGQICWVWVGARPGA